MTEQSAENRQQGAQEKKSAREGEQMLFVGAKRALMGGLLAAGVALAGQLFVGQVYSGTEARALLEAMMPAVRTVGTSVVTATSTILTLMLTMLSLTRQANINFDAEFYRRIKHIGLMSTIGLSSAILVLLFISIPLQASQQVSQVWYRVIYYLLVALVAGLAGLLVAIVLMLYNALASLIRVISPAHDTPDDLIHGGSSQGQQQGSQGGEGQKQGGQDSQGGEGQKQGSQGSNGQEPQEQAAQPGTTS